jgi:hypothetical protein
MDNFKIEEDIFSLRQDKLLWHFDLHKIPNMRQKHFPFTRRFTAKLHNYLPTTSEL